MIFHSLFGNSSSFSLRDVRILLILSIWWLRENSWNIYHPYYLSPCVVESQRRSNRSLTDSLIRWIFCTIKKYRRQRNACKFFSTKKWSNRFNLKRGFSRIAEREDSHKRAQFEETKCLDWFPFVNFSRHWQSTTNRVCLSVSDPANRINGHSMHGHRQTH